jgi:hypothetical protein
MSHDATARSFDMTPANLAVASAASEETLVADARSGVTPAQMVEKRLVFLLQGTPLPRGSRETFEPRRALSYTGAGDQPHPARQRIMDRGVPLGTSLALP